MERRRRFLPDLWARVIQIKATYRQARAFDGGHPDRRIIEDNTALLELTHDQTLKVINGLHSICICHFLDSVVTRISSLHFTTSFHHAFWPWSVTATSPASGFQAPTAPAKRHRGSQRQQSRKEVLHTHQAKKSRLPRWAKPTSSPTHPPPPPSQPKKTCSSSPNHAVPAYRPKWSSARGSPPRTR